MAERTLRALSDLYAALLRVESAAQDDGLDLAAGYPDGWPALEEVSANVAVWCDTQRSLATERRAVYAQDDV